MSLGWTPTKKVLGVLWFCFKTQVLLSTPPAKSTKPTPKNRWTPPKKMTGVLLVLL